MGSSFIKIFGLCLVCFNLISLETSSINPSHILYLMHTSKTQKALSLYQEYCKQRNELDLSLLQSICHIILEKGSESTNDEILLLTMYGAGQALSSKSLDVLAKGLSSKNPQIQLTALHFFAKIQDDRVDPYLSRAMSSPFLPLRLEALFYLTERKSPLAFGHAESLMYRLPPELKPIFAGLFANLGTKEALNYWKSFFHDSKISVRIEAILQAAYRSRDDFLDLIRPKLQGPNSAEKEASCFAIGILKDSSSETALKAINTDNMENLELARDLALYRLGHLEVKPQIEKLALSNNLFAIQALKEIDGVENVLSSLLKSSSFVVRVNAALVLLEKQNELCMEPLKELFIHDQKDLALKQIFSAGKSLSAWQIVTSASARKDDPSFSYEAASHFKQIFFKKIADLSEDSAINLVKTVFESNERDLIEPAVSILESLPSEKAKNLLKTYALKESSTLLKDYCSLALFRLREEGSWNNYLKTRLMVLCKNQLIRLQNYLPWQARLDPKSYDLTPEETSKILVDTYLAFAERREKVFLEAIVESFKNSSFKNQYVLAGLILRASE